jgi:hypothetical protein
MTSVKNPLDVNKSLANLNPPLSINAQPMDHSVSAMSSAPARLINTQACDSEWNFIDAH